MKAIMQLLRSQIEKTVLEVVKTSIEEIKQVLALHAKHIGNNCVKIEAQRQRLDSVESKQNKKGKGKKNKGDVSLNRNEDC